MTERRVCHRNEGLERQEAIPQKKLANNGENWEIAAGPGRPGGSHQEQELRWIWGGSFGRGGRSGLEEEYVGDLHHKDLEGGEEREIWLFFNLQTLVLTQETGEKESFCPFN